MKYMGSKSRIAKHIVPIIQKYVDENAEKFGSSKYLEPFCGGCNVIDKIVNADRTACDSNSFLIALLRYVREGGVLPESISRDEYSRVREYYKSIIRDKKYTEIYDEWYVGCVGFLASYNGRFFDGGYAQPGYEGTRYRDYYAESKRNLEAQVPLLNMSFFCHDYRDLNPINCVVYCDPPYQNTKQYSNSINFNHYEFWDIMREWSKSNVVLISEENAPDDFECIWSAEVSRSIKSTDKSVSVEKLFKYTGEIKRRLKPKAGWLII